MIAIEDFLKMKDQGTVPDDLSPLLRALLLDASGNWEDAHRLCQADPAADGAWVHAYLHRKEGDLSNAAYWYGRSGKKMSDLTLEEEWEYIAQALIRKS